MSSLTGDDLARPAKDLPLKAIRSLGLMLHRAQYNSGNWETIAEDLGYDYEDIKHFKSMADVRQESPPGELMLRDWVQRFTGCTLFVLHSALAKAERLDCVEYLESEIYKRVVCMDLMVCVRYEDGRSADHMCVTTRADSNLLDSLQNHLEQPLTRRYKLLDHSVSWNTTRARELKGRQLMLLKNSEEVQMEQDPTIDSSGLGLTGLDQSESTMMKNSPVSTSYLRTIQNFTTDIRSTTFHQELRRVNETGSNIDFGDHTSYHQTGSSAFPASDRISLTNSGTVWSNSQNISSSQNLLNQSSPRPTLNRLVLSSNDQAVSVREENNLNIISKREELETSQQSLNISDKKIDNVNNNNAAAKSHQSHYSNSMNQKDAIDFRKPSLDREPHEHSDTNEYRDTCEYIDSCEYKDAGNYRDPNECMDSGEYRDAGNYRDPNECMDSGEYRDAGEYRNPSDKGGSSDGEIRFHSEGFDVSSILHSDTELKHIETQNEQENTEKQNSEATNVFDTGEYQYASENSNTFAKQENCSRELKKNFQSNNDPDIDISIKFASYKSSDFNSDSETYNTHPESQRTFDNIEDSQDEMYIDDANNGEAASTDNLSNQLDKGIDENAEEARVYLDFNKYDQGSINITMDSNRENVEEANCEFLNKENVVEVASARTQHMPPRRFISEMTGVPASKSSERKVYESLQRGLSCPSEIVYEKSMVFQEEHDIITIADVFSPVSEESKINDFEAISSTETQSSINSEILYRTETQSSINSEILDRSVSPSSKRHSLPMIRPCQNVKRTKFLRHTFQHGDKVVRFKESPRQEFSKTQQESPELPPRGRLPPLPVEDMSRRRSKDSITSVSPGVIEASGKEHCCKIVVGAKSSRPALDGLLANDKLFTHYKSTLSGFRGWSPRETENTVEKTMADALTSDGYYILWYIRGRKNLVISVSFRGTLVHYRVHTKVLSNELHYYITQGRYFDDIIEMLQHYLRYGVRAPADVRGGHSNAHDYRIPLRCPVLVQYEPRPAISV